jgi:hypothetical protein
MATETATNPWEAWLLPFTTAFTAPFASFLRTWDYRPVTSWFDNFITVNWNSQDADVEEHVLGRVGSYGLQLGRVLDAMDVLIDQLGLTNLTKEQQASLVRVQDLAASARHAVDDFRGRPAPPAG